MGLIFFFSSQTADESSESSRFTSNILFVILGIDDAESIFADTELYSLIDFIVRKCAHFIIFAVLGFLLYSAMTQYPPVFQYSNAIISFAAGVAYACSDELHQYFVPGRACQFRDVCIDSAGVLCGVLAAWGIIRLCGYIRRRREDRKGQKIQ